MQYCKGKFNKSFFFFFSKQRECIFNYCLTNIIYFKVKQNNCNIKYEKKCKKEICVYELFEHVEILTYGYNSL